MIQISSLSCLNEKGRRPNNEDAIWPEKGIASSNDRLFLVCDGVGGNSKGEVASALTCKCFSEYFKKHLKPGQKPDTRFINAAYGYTLSKFEEYVSDNPGAAQMSTTLTLAFINDNSLFLAWCGDSRIYLIRKGRIIYQTEDHSLVNELVRSGELTAEQAAKHPQKNIILRAIQLKDNPSEIETVEMNDVQNGDYLLMCTDGLLENVNPEVLKKTLVNASNTNYGDKFQSYCFERTNDNYSMYLLELEKSNEGIPVTTTRQAKKARVSGFALFMIIVLLAVGAFAWNMLLKDKKSTPVKQLAPSDVTIKSKESVAIPQKKPETSKIPIHDSLSKKSTAHADSIKNDKIVKNVDKPTPTDNKAGKLIKELENKKNNGRETPDQGELKNSTAPIKKLDTTTVKKLDTTKIKRNRP